jgi:sugar phosphate isomerase/epimerase
MENQGEIIMRVGCCAYSYRQYLTKDEMTLVDFLDKAVEMDLDGVELTSYYFKSTDDEYIHELKRQCYLRGLDISATAVGNRFTVADEAQRVEQIQMVKDWIDNAVKLGAPCIRVFAGGVPDGHTEEEARKWTIAGLEECADYGESRGVIVALENHGGITSTAEGTISLIEDVDSEWLKANLDTGNYRQDPYESIAKTALYAVTCHTKVEVPSGAKNPELDAEKLVKILDEVGYKGYLSIEYESAEDPMTAVPKFVAKLIDAVR